MNGSFVVTNQAEKRAISRERRLIRQANASSLKNPLNAGVVENSPAPSGERPSWCQGASPSFWQREAGRLPRLEIHPAAVGTPVVPNRALTPRFAGLRFPPSAPSLSLNSPSAIRDGLDGHPRSGGSRPARAGLTAAWPHSRSWLGPATPFPARGRAYSDHPVNARSAGAAQSFSCFSQLDAAQMQPHQEFRLWAACIPCLPWGGGCAGFRAQSALRYLRPAERLALLSATLPRERKELALSCCL